MKPSSLSYAVAALLASLPCSNATPTSSSPSESASCGCPPTSDLFPPNYNYCNGFTTAPDVFVPGVEQAKLDDKELNVFKVAKNTTHNVVEHEGKLAWEAIYPNGSFNPSGPIKGGFSFYINGTDNFKEALKTANEAMFSYSVFFESEFDFVKGGKLPGACTCRFSIFFLFVC